MIARAPLSLTLVCAACSQPPTERPVSESERQYGPQSTIVGPFVNDPVAPMPTLAALPARGSTAPLIRGGEVGAANNAQPSPGDPLGTEQPTPEQPNTANTNPVPEVPAVQPEPSEDPQRRSRDALLDGLVGVWSDSDGSIPRPETRSVTGECILTIRSPTDAREVCTTTTFYGTQRDACGETGRTRVWATASPYTLTVDGANVRFLPGTVELVRDDESACRRRAAMTHTIMVTRDWQGTGDVINVTTMGLDGSNPSTATYRRRRAGAQR
jgi:hypothetical protein